MFQLVPFLLTCAAHPQEPSLLQPARYASPSGSVVLEVDPSHRLGIGRARYRLIRDEVEAWSTELPFAFWEAVVDDQGFAGGYAYTGGEFFDEGELIVAILSPDGETLLSDSVERKSCRVMHCSPVPSVLGVHLHPDLGRMVVRVRLEHQNSASEEWWIYDLGAGRLLAKAKPRDLLGASSSNQRTTGKPGDPPDRLSIAVRPVIGTPLTLCQWYRWSGFLVGATVVLYDSEIRPVWTRVFPDEYTLPEGDDREERLRDDRLRVRARFGEFVPPCDRARGFDLILVKEAARVAFEVTPDESSSSEWVVSEVGREHFEVFPPQAEDAITEALLEPVADVPLVASGRPSESPVRDILAFDSAGEGSIRFVRGKHTEGEATIVDLDASGAVVREVEIRKLPATDSCAFTWFPLEEEAWIAVRTVWADPLLTTLWRVTSEGETVEIAESERMSVDELVATEDGGFVGLFTRHDEYTLTDALVCFDREGRERWRNWGSFDSDDEGKLFSPEDVSVLADGTILVLDNIRDLMQFYDEEGRFLSSTDLEAAWGVEPRYPTDVVPLPDGDVLVRDVDSDPAWRRTSLHLKSSGGITLKRPDGDLEVGRDESLRADERGNLWSTDGRVLMEFDREGTLVRFLGEGKDLEALKEPNAVFSDAFGRIGVFDVRTQVVHVFDVSGSPLLRCVPEPTDLEPGAWIDRLIAGGDGSCHLALERYDDEYMSFDAHGGRVGRTTLGGVRATFVPRTRDRWVIHDEGWDEHWIDRIGDDGEVVASAKRRADGKWFVDVGCIGVSKSGAVAVLDQGESHWYSHGPYTLSFHEPDGRPVRTIELPPLTRHFRYVERIDYGSRYLTIHAYGPEVVLLLLPGGEMSRFTVPGDSREETQWSIGLSPDETELWAVGSNPPALHRFALAQ